MIPADAKEKSKKGRIFTLCTSDLDQSYTSIFQAIGGGVFVILALHMIITDLSIEQDQSVPCSRNVQLRTHNKR